MLSTVALFALAFSGPVEPAGKFALEDGDRVVFYGDSITASNEYTKFLEVFIRTRHPELKISYHNAAVPGEASWGGPMGRTKDRVERDVNPFSPTHVAIMLGMNDGGYVSYSAYLEEKFKESYDDLVTRIVKENPGVRLSLIRTSPFDNLTKGLTGERSTFAKDYNDALQRYGGVIQAVAQRTKAHYIDFNQPLYDLLNESRRRDFVASRALIPDCTHPSVAAHLMMAALLYKNWNGGGLVSEVDIDAKKHAVKEVKNAEVTLLAGTTLRWRQIEKCLPFPVPTDRTTQFFTGIWPFQDTFNSQILRVRNLREGDYRLNIDTQDIGTFPAEFYEVGINLAEFETPMLARSREVLRLIDKKGQRQHNRWQSIRRTAPLTLSEALYEASEPIEREIARITARRPVIVSVTRVETSGGPGGD
ncbi:MAG: SGNH/GDSL hydrolase family protein [Chthonomonas sp.]|nr:SGNH/GDSL hydrolase family protein [Chthonomonas sp.]